MLILTLASRWLLAVVLLAAGLAKIGRSGSFGEAISRYGLLPRPAIPIAARILPVVELVLGVALAAGVLEAPAAVAAASLFGAFATAVAVSLARGRRFDCGCGLSADAEITWWHVGRSLLLATLGVLIAVEPAVLALNAGHVEGAPATRQLIAVPLGVLLVGIAWRLISVLRQNASLIRAGRLAHRPAVSPPIREV